MFDVSVCAKHMNLRLDVHACMQLWPRHGCFPEFEDSSTHDMFIGPPAKVLQLMRRNPVFVFVRIFVF